MRLPRKAAHSPAIFGSNPPDFFALTFAGGHLPASIGK